jgi:hypothetical protein
MAAMTIAEESVVPPHPPVELARIRVDEELVRIEAVAVPGLVGAVHPVAVELAGMKTRDIAVPDLVGPAGEGDPRGLAPARRFE